MTTRTLLLVVHIVAVGGWLGANFVQIILARRMGSGQPAVAAGWTRQTIWLGQRYYPAAGALIAISGTLLWLDGPWRLAAGFPWVGVAVVFVGGAMGGMLFGPLGERRAAALDSGDTATADGALATTLRAAYLDTALVVLAVLAMVHKWMA